VQKRLKGVPDLPFPPIVAGLYGIVSGFLVYSTPQWLFEHAVDMSGIAQFIPAATPPLGEKARLLCAGASVFAVALALWPALAMAQSVVRKMRKKPEVHVRARGIVIADSMDNSVVSHLTTPHEVGLPGGVRAPIFADNELGAPLMSDEALVAGEELVLDAPLDLSMPQAEPAYASLAPDFAEPVAAEPLELEIEPMPSPSRADFAQWEPTEARPMQDVFAASVPSAPVSQFQISIPLQMESEPEPAPMAVFEAPDIAPVETPTMNVAFPEAAPVAQFEEAPAAPASYERETVSPYQIVANPEDEDALVAEWEASLPPRGKPMPAAGMEIETPRDASLSINLFPQPAVVEPETAFVAPVVEQAAAAVVDANHDVFARLSGDSMRVSMFPTEAPAPEPVAASIAAPVAVESQFAAMPAPAASAPAAAAAPQDDSVGGLMARLNSAMGAKTKAAVDQNASLGGMKVNFGVGRPAF
jgi:hypothetical protein